MENVCLRSLVNSICRLIHLISCRTRKHVPIQDDYNRILMVLKLLKPVLDDIVDSLVSSDKMLCEACEKLDVVVNDARDYLENWSGKMSKICSVRDSGALSVKIQSSSLGICSTLCRLLQSSPPIPSFIRVQNCMQELQSMKQDTVASHVEKALSYQRDDATPNTDHLVKIIESLNLGSTEELLTESIAVEEERVNAQSINAEGDLDYINQIVDMLSSIRSYLIEVDMYEPKGHIAVPTYFRCPLSLELMVDPVIVASGQTYERASIQKWLDHGLTICPKTRQSLAHTNVIPNYTVKAMIGNWCNTRISSDSERSNSFRPSLCDSISASRFPREVSNGADMQKGNSSFWLHEEEPIGFQIQDTRTSQPPSHELSYIHSRSVSMSSATSSIEDAHPASTTTVGNANDWSGEIVSEYPASSPSKKEAGISSWLCGKHFNGAETVSGNGNDNHHYRQDSLQTTTARIKKWIEDLRSQSNEVQTTAAAELRLLAKHSMDNRVIIGKCGAIKPLLSLLYSEVEVTQQQAVTALLNLSINKENKVMIAEAGAIEPLIHVLKSGNNEAKENSAAALFSLSVVEEYKAKIGGSGAIKALVDLLGSGSVRGKKDAATALFNLSIYHENKARMVQAGAVKYLVELLDPETEMVDKAVAVLANLSTVGEGRRGIVEEGGIPLLVEIVEWGSQRGKENAASVLMQLCLNSPKFCTLVLQEGAVPPLVALSQCGTPRAKEKSQQLLSHFRNQREGCKGKR